MRPHGRYLRFRHVMPELFGPSVQARRGMLRLRWFLLQRIDFRPIWTLGAAAGLGGVLLTVSLFFLQGNLRPVIASTEPAYTPTVATVPPQIIQPSLQPLTPYPIAPPPAPQPQTQALLPYLAPAFSRLVMPFGWEDRRLLTARSEPQPMEPTLPFNFNRQDLWARASFRAFNNSAPQTFIPYREPSSLRWDSVTPEVRYSPVARRNSGVSAVTRPHAVVEKQIPTSHSGTGPLEYRLIVRNPSPTKPLLDVSVFEAVDVNRVTAANPPARVEPNGLVWKLHGLAPGETRELAVSIWTEGLQEISSATEVELADQVATTVQVDGQTEEPFFTRDPIAAPSPAIDLPAFPRVSDLPAFPALNDVRAPVPPPANPGMPAFPSFPSLPANPAPSPAPAPAPQGRPLLKLTTEPPMAVAVGEDATTWYEIENIGDAAATDVVLRLQLAEGLKHHDGSRDVEFMVPRLAPGEKRRARLVTRVETHGVYDVNGQLSSGEQTESTSVQLFAPQRESVAGESEPATDNRRQRDGTCNCTLLVNRSVNRR